MENIREKLGKRIRTLRKARGITQEGLGEKANLNYKYIGEIERGEVNPSIETLSALADALNISIGQLFEDESQLPLDHQLLPKDIQLIKEALPLLNQILSDWEAKDFGLIKQAISLLNKLFPKP